MKFYTFSQNNSGGSYVLDRDGMGQYIVVEACSYMIANSLAEDKGIYFDGVAAGRDCDCCGDRWERVHDRDGNDVPIVQNKQLVHFDASHDGFMPVMVHLLSGETVKMFF